MSDFKYLVNATKSDFVFQFDSIEYVVPAMSRKLMLKEVAEHGEKRSIFLSDPKFDSDGNVISPGNDVYKKCYCEDADVVSPVNSHEPILVEKNKDKVDNLADLSVDPEKPIKRTVGRPKKDIEGIVNEVA